jgi:predicted ABC-type ATPase
MPRLIPLLFIKSHIRGYTRKDGTYVQDHYDKRQAKPDEPHGSAHGYGTHNIEHGDTVHFQAGEFKGSGRVVAAGEHGATVHDSTGREHRVHWHEVTGFKPKEGTKKPDTDSQVLGDRKPVPPDQFKAAEWAKGHDDANVTPESILKGFPPDTEQKIADVQKRLGSIEQTIDKYRQDGVYTDERRKLHDQIIGHFFSPEKVAACTPKEGEKPTFTMLGGRGGSGKSWFKGKVYDPNTNIVLDADEIKGMLPEYEGWNAHQVHEESSDILEAILDLARDAGLNVVLDATMKTAKSALKKVEQFKGNGYRIEAHYMHLPRQEAAKRAVSRFLGKTQRFVPPQVVLSNTTNEASFDEIRKHADAWSFRDNNVKQGEEPILISEQKGSGGELRKSAIMLLWRLK